MSISEKLIIYRQEITKNLNNKELLEYVYEKFKDEIKEYLENPLLLRPYLGVIIEPLVDYLKSMDGSEDLYAYKFLAVICNVIGYKCLLSFLPHNISILPKIVSKLNNVQQDDLFQCWEKYYVLLLWLAIVCKNPFNFLLMDKKSNAQGDLLIENTLTQDIIKICQRYLLVKTKCADAAAYLAGQYFSRSEIMVKYLPTFLLWSQENLSNTNVQATKSILLAITYIFKNGDRDALLPFAQTFTKYLIDQHDLAQSPHAVIRKHYLKAIQHLVISNLDPSLAISRVECLRNKRSYKERVMENVVNNEMFAKTLPDNKEKQNYHDSCKTSNTHSPTLAVNGHQSEQNNPLIIEQAIKLLVNGLCDKDSDIHYTAAKGISRISLHLPEAYLDKIIEAILTLFAPKTVGDTGWHGGCIGLAEMARKALIPRACMEKAMGCLWQALHFEKRSGTTYVGSRVRDAASYAYWSLVRTYELDQLAPYLPRVSKELLNVALFDMDDKCRRAASATFQEFVGRLGEEMIPAGIEILTKVDFHAVSNIDRCYLELAPYVASLGRNSPKNYEYYRTSILDHLVDDRLGHCEPRVRNLAATCLGEIVSRCFRTSTNDPQMVTKELLRNLVERLLAKNDINASDARGGYFGDHGTLKAIGEVVKGMRCCDLGLVLGHDIVGKLKDLVKTRISKTTITISDTNRQLIEGDRWILSALCNLLSCLLTSLQSHNFSFFNETANAEVDRSSIPLVDALQNVIYPSVMAEHGPCTYDISLSLNNNSECLLQYACQALKDVCHFVIAKHELTGRPNMPLDLVNCLKKYIVNPYVEPLREYALTILPQMDKTSYVNNNMRISCCYAISSIPAALLLTTGNLNSSNNSNPDDDLVSLLLDIASAELGSCVDIRKAALDALIRISVSLIELVSTNTDDHALDINTILGRVLKEGVVATGLYDYTRDNQRGDIGRTVRQAALLGLNYLLSALLSHYEKLKSIIDWKLLIGSELSIALVRQAWSKLQPIRIQSGAVLTQLMDLHGKIGDCGVIDCTEYMTPLKDIFLRADIDWSNASHSYSTVLPLLKDSHYCYPVLSEFLTSLGCLSDDTAKHSTNALREYLLKANNADIQLFGTTLNGIYRAQALKEIPKSHVPIDHITLLRATEAIVNLNCIPFGENATFYAQLLNNVRDLLVTKPRMTINKILVALKIFGGFLLMTDDSRHEMFLHSNSEIDANSLTAFKRTVYGISDNYLFHKIPRVRKCTAEMLYEYFLVGGQEVCPSPEILVHVTSILSECDWMCMAEAEKKTKELRTLCGFQC